MRSKLSLIAFCVLLLSSTAFADKTFAPTAKVGERTVELNGFGLCEYGMFGINLYWGALYLEEKDSRASSIIKSKQAKRIQLDFVRALTKKQLQKAFTAAFKVNAGDQLSKYSAGLAKLNKMLVAVKVDDVLAFNYDPDAKQMIVTLNSKTLGTIDGENWARMFVQLYLGPKPPDKNMKKGMLGSK